MRIVSNSEVNNKYVLVLKEDQNKNLSVQEQPIKSSDVLIAEVQAIVDNPNKTVWDLYSKVERYLNPKIGYSLCFPYEYNDSFIDAAMCPEVVKYYSHYDLMKKRREAILRSNNYTKLKEEYKDSYLEKLLSSYEDKLKQEEQSKKKEYADVALRFILCSNLEETLSKIRGDKTIKMYSSDNLGWTTFTYTVSDDIQVMVKTNFGYGSAAYLFLVVKYKDMVLIPYSDLVHYYYANMKNLVSYTRSYARRRESWKYALSYVADFVNQSKESPEQFIRQYVLAEINEMMKGLREIMKKPGEIMEHIKDSKVDYINMNVIRPFMLEDENLFAMMPSESVSVFKAEKISGALLFLNSLNQIKDLCPETIQVINEVREMNQQIKPEVKTTIKSIQDDLKPLEEDLNEKNKESDKLSKILDYHQSKINKLIGDKSKLDADEIREKYKKEHPGYMEAYNKWRELFDEISNLQVLVRRRKRLKERMEVCLERINNRDYKLN